MAILLLKVGLGHPDVTLPITEPSSSIISKSFLNTGPVEINPTRRCLTVFKDWLTIIELPGNTPPFFLPFPKTISKH